MIVETLGLLVSLGAFALADIFGARKTEVKMPAVQLPQQSATEQEAEQIGLKLSRAQLAEFERAQAERATFEASPQFAAEQRLQAAATENLLARLEGRAPVLSPEAQQRVGTAFGAAKERGLQDLTRLANETAAMRGLTRADTPISQPFLQESGRFLQGLEGTRAGAELDVGQSEALFNQSLADFQSRLQQQAFMNRLSLAGGQFAPQAGGLAQNLFAQRMAAAPRSQVSRLFPSGLDVFRGVTEGLGSLASGVGGAAKGFATSTARVKRSITPLTRHAQDEALRMIRETPVVRYRYQWESDTDRDPHIGPVLESSPSLLTDDGVTVNLLDYLGLLHAAVQALANEVQASNG